MCKRLWVIFAAAAVGVTANASERGSVMYGPTDPVQAALLEATVAQAPSEGDEVEIPVIDTALEPKISGGYKSPKRAFFLSLLLPGAGHLYLRSSQLVTGMGIGHLALEATSWLLWAKYRGDRDSLEDDFAAFAESNWSADRYLSWRKAVWDNTSTSSNYFETFTAPDDSIKLIGTHHYDACCGQEMPERTDQLEVIGKYDQFVYGWQDVRDFDDSTRYVGQDFILQAQVLAGVEWGTDWAEWAGAGARYIQVGFDTLTSSFRVLNMSGSYTNHYLDDVNLRSDLRAEYLDLRDQRNAAGKRMETWAWVMVGNRLVSAIVAARMAKKYNEARETGAAFERPTTHLSFEVKETPNGTVSMLVLSKERLPW